jgi:replicative DNA helicase Mcm
VSITARQLESLIRLSQACARMRMSKDVTTDDANTAVEVLEASLRQVALDADTGQIDIDKLVGSACFSDKQLAKRVLEDIRRIAEEKGNPKNSVTIIELKESFALKNISSHQVEISLDVLRESGQIYGENSLVVRLVNP